ncbi:unnamed protein product [Hymenolepis diminuta]|uniref:Uncharacterized protein n=1 Tax=Hymenolepis diminuta TaxID=6216 RepID=A0A564YCJ8_HYMDI|nr:unnamed protein product [Hymenolepis diminuta]
MRFTTLTRLIESRALELSGKCGDVTGCVENKCVRVCRDLLNQSAIKIPAPQHGIVFND